MTTTRPTTVQTRLAWGNLLPRSVYDLCRAFSFRLLTPGQLGPELFHKQVWYVAHLGAALAAFLWGPLPFRTSRRTRRPARRLLIGRNSIA